MEKTVHQFQTTTCKQRTLLLTRECASKPQRLLLLHGAGVAGETTWTFLAHYLTQWDEILIPDLAGMGEAQFLNNQAPKLQDYVNQVKELLAYFNWPKYEFDIAGYSFGGLVAESLLRHQPFNQLCFLLEPAMLFSGDCEQVVDKGQCYLRVAKEVLANPSAELPYHHFLDLVSPKREKEGRTERLIIQRLQENAQGLAQALMAITDALNQDCVYYTQWQAPMAGASFVGGLSWDVMHQRHQCLAKESANWHYETVANADHSLVFTRPRSIAAVMNALKQRVTDSKS